MRVSEYFNLHRNQPTLDFVDVDVFGDAKVFLDPRALRLIPSKWGDECVSLIQNFFRTVLMFIHNNDHPNAQKLLGLLKEPNETHLGLSKKRAQGRALGRGSAYDVWAALRKSEAVASGLLEDLEDTILMVEGISSDIISDIATNIIRQPLIHYTQDISSSYGIPLIPDIPSGPMWDPRNLKWFTEYVSLPMTKWGKLLLVPKIIVRRRMDYDVAEYYQHYLLSYLQDVELNANSELVQLLKNGPRVTKKDLSAKYGRGKSMIANQTRNYPEVLQRYRDFKRQNFRPPLDHSEFAESEGTPMPDWNTLLNELMTIQTGHEDFSKYEHSIESLLSALFYPSLTNPQIQRPIHEGRKRVDIMYTNVATNGFFLWLSQHFSAPYIYIECKNYEGDPANPELDQLSGRFSPSRGQVGIIICRKFKDKKLFLKRCKDTADDQRGFILVIDDKDLALLVDECKNSTKLPEYELLKKQFETLIL